MSDAATVGPTWLLPPPFLQPQRDEVRAHWLDQIEAVVTGIQPVMLPGFQLRRLQKIVRATDQFAVRFAGASDRALSEAALELRPLLRSEGLQLGHVAQSFALIRELAKRTIGQRHFDVQLLGGYALLKGMLAEMATGEGKTLTATLAAGTAGLAGTPVHIVTVNDYLAARDAAAMAPLFRALGLSIGVIVHDTPPAQRRAAYACDITYVTNKEVAFDYLRDRLVLGPNSANLRLKLERLAGEARRSAGLVMRGLHYAIVDEADSVLVDEARTPLIISGHPEAVDDRRWANEALEVVRELTEGVDYRVLLDERRIELTEIGKHHAAEIGEKLGGLWCSTIRREESLRQALSAIHVFRNGEQYLVREGKIEIVDEYTGRIMPDRSWNEGLHQLIEAKEGCQITERKVPLARISYQRFFRRYQQLAGMSGTAREVAGELWAVYRLAVATIPTNRPVIRQDRSPTVCATIDEKLNRIVTRAAALRGEGRAVLIGTRSVASSQALAARLEAAQLPHVVLNAAQDAHEADVIAQAADPGRITVATNMAGRGVDIQVGDEVLRGGGLYVILSEYHDAGRIDRQLMGRCGRQGEPGTTEAIISLDDPLLDVFNWRKVLRRHIDLTRSFDRKYARLLFRFAQRKAERIHSRIRRRLLRSDQRLGTLLAFSGELE